MALTPSDFLQSDSNLFAQNRLLKLGFFALIMVSLWNGWSVHNLKNSLRTAVLPPFSDKEWVVTGNDANETYLSDMSLYLLQMMGTWNPGSVREQLNEVLKLIHPDSYPRYRDQFKDVADRAQRYASVSFVVQWDPGHKIERVDNTVTIHAMRRRITGNRTVRPEAVAYVFHFEIIAGRFWIRDISEKKGGSDASAESA